MPNLVSLVRKGQSIEPDFILFPLPENEIADNKIYSIGKKKFKAVVADSSIPMDSPDSWTNRVNHIMEHG